MTTYQLGNTHKVLVIDDDRSLVTMMAIILRSEGYAVEKALDGVSGLERIGSAAPDLVILDISMPGMDGRHVFAAARAMGYCGPIVICSAFGAADTGRELGADVAISKPFDPKDLCCVVGRLLGAAPTAWIERRAAA